MTGDGKRALVLFAHGSRDPQWAEPFRALQGRVAAASGIAVELAFLEVMSPSLPDAVDGLAASGHRRVIIAPLFMAQGAHLKRDLSGMLETLRGRHADIGIELLPALGEVDEVLDAVASWLAARA